MRINILFAIIVVSLACALEASQDQKCVQKKMSSYQMGLNFSLQNAIDASDVSAVETALGDGAQVNARDRITNQTPLARALGNAYGAWHGGRSFENERNAYLAIVKILLRKGADVSEDSVQKQIEKIKTSIFEENHPLLEALREVRRGPHGSYQPLSGHLCSIQ